MKTYTLLFIAIAGVFSSSSFGQGNDLTRGNGKMGNTQFLHSNIADDNDLAVVSYHVEERINMAFGSRITTYDVSTLSLVETNDLGQNNVRIVTPKFAKIKPSAAVSNEQPTPPVEVVPTPAEPVAPAPATEERSKYAYIDILATYERVIDRGYKTIEMLTRVGNGRFFDGDLVMAAKWYNQLFELTTDLAPEYYFRYAQSLKAIGQNEKAKKMMEVFERKNLENDVQKGKH